MSVIAELSLFPVDKGKSLSPYVARVIDVIRQSGLNFELGPMGTCIEGDWKDVIQVIDRCFEAMRSESERIYMTLKMDYSQGRQGGLNTKVDSVKNKLPKKE